MKLPLRVVVGVSTAVLVTIAGTTTAVALWAANGVSGTANLTLGAVTFAGAAQGGSPAYSQGGSPVTVTLPGQAIIAVMNQTGVNPAPVIWRFALQGYAQGIAGLTADVTVVDQIAGDGTVTSLDSGEADPGTFLGGSTMKVYPASVNGDCSAVPDTPDGPARNIYLYDNTDHVVQAAGAYDGGEVSQPWCVALDYNVQPDAEYANEVQATATADDLTEHGAMARWSAVVAFPPSLAVMGQYANQAEAAGTAKDGTTSRDTDYFRASVYPDPALEPDVTIQLTPHITTVTP